MSNKVCLTVSGPSARQWTFTFSGDNYGHDAALGIMTASDVVERVQDPDNDRYRLVFQITAGEARDRLACYGFTSAKSAHEVERALQSEPRFTGASRLQPAERLTDAVRPWTESLERGSPGGERAWELLVESMDGYFIEPDLFPMLHGIAVVASAAPPESVITVDLSDSDCAWDESGETLLEDFKPIELSEFRPAAILTEGTFDADVLRHAISATHPHLHQHIRVADFGLSREGGSSALGKLVRGLASVGVDHTRVIAIFDADRVGTLEATRLREAGLPPNFSIVTLPAIPELGTYPVIGVDGVNASDVNGWGAAVETYLAVELQMVECAPLVLSYDHGRSGGYQGVLPAHTKTAIQHAYEEAIRHDREWPILQRVVQHVLHADDHRSLEL